MDGQPYMGGNLSPLPSPEFFVGASASPSPSPSTSASGGSSNESVESGTIRFLGTGTLPHRRGSAGITQEVHAVVNPTAVQFDVKSFRAVSGDNRSQVDEEISQKTGLLNFIRSSRQRVDQQTAAGYLRTKDFLLFVDRSEDRRGVRSDRPAITATFSSPLPVLVVPGPKSRYDNLVDRPQAINNSITTQGRTIQVLTRISLAASTSNTARIVIENTVAADAAGELYQLLPVAKRTEFVIDTEIRQVTQILSTAHYHDEDDEQRFDTTLNLALCSILKNGNLQTFGTCRNR
jgi:hypothetical protein